MATNVLLRLACISQVLSVCWEIPLVKRVQLYHGALV